MTNAEKYNFADFTLEEYRKILQQAKEQNYQFRFFTDFNKDEKFALWRHDLDFSVHSAKKMAQIEQEENIKSTYFIHLHNEFYNLLEAEVSNLIKDIIKMGHQIGLHFDTHYYNIQDARLLDEKIKLEANFLNNIFDTEIKVFSFHNTTPFTMNCKEEMYGGLINTYANYFQENVTYCSDSNGYWRFKRIIDVVKENNPRIQILTHEWWQAEVMSPKQRIHRWINGRAEKTKNFYDNLLKNINRENIDE